MTVKLNCIFNEQQHSITQHFLLPTTISEKTWKASATAVPVDNSAPVL